MTAKILEGNVLETLKDVPACSVQCAVTSPPYYGLRDYGMAGQIGLEPIQSISKILFWRHWIKIIGLRNFTFDAAIEAAGWKGSSENSVGSDGT